MAKAVCRSEKTLWALTSAQQTALTAFLESISMGLQSEQLLSLRLHRVEDKSIELDLAFEQTVDETELLDKLLSGEISKLLSKTA